MYCMGLIDKILFSGAQLSNSGSKHLCSKKTSTLILVSIHFSLNLAYLLHFKWLVSAPT